MDLTLDIALIFGAIALGYVLGRNSGLSRESKSIASLTKSGFPDDKRRDFNPIPQPKTYQVRTPLYPGRVK